MNTIPASKRSFPFFYFIHAATIFVSAFLVFQIQPMISKSLLPWFGGSSSVWTTSLLFFTTSLFVGYLYVYLISKRSIRFQTIAHLVLLGITVALVISSLITRNTLTISLDWTTTSSTDPSVLVLIALAGSVGLPYVALSATCPLIQHWFSTSTSKEPYKLYAISNAGSFLALLTYPFIFERLATLKFQQIMW